MIEVRLTNDILFKAWIRNELIHLWGNLENAHRWTIGNDGYHLRNRPWSMAADGFAERIRTATDLVGPVRWQDIGVPLLTDGWFRWANEKIGITNPNLPTKDELDQCRTLHDGLRYNPVRDGRHYSDHLGVFEP